MSSSARESLTAEEKKFIQAQEKVILEQTTAFINATNLQSMEGVQRSILDAIKNLDTTGNLYKDPTGKYCYLQEDVLKAIQSGYDNYNMAYEELTKSMNPKNEEHIAHQLKVIDNGMKVAGLSQGQIDKEITELQEQTKKAILEETAAARAKPLPASNSNSNSNSNSGYNTNNEDVRRLSTNNLLHSQFVRKHKKSRKHPK